MNSQVDPARRRPGRPSKFGRPSRVIAVTLPEDAIDRLRRVHRDLGWAIVNLLDGGSPRAPARASTRQEVEPDVELVTIADRRSLIVVNREVIRNLPGVNIIPLSGNRAFLALDIDRGMSDLELAVSDRLTDVSVDRRERRALADLQAQLRIWRRDQALRVHTRAIIVLERPVTRPSGRGRRAAAGQSAGRRPAAQERAVAAGLRAPLRNERPAISVRETLPT